MTAIGNTRRVMGIGLGAAVIALGTWLGFSGPVAAQDTAIDTITGFRSAEFGMNQRDVTRAIKKDFGLDDAEIREQTDPVGKRDALIVTVTNLLADSGVSTIGYVFGHSSKRLVQINVVFGSSVDAEVDPNNTLATAQILRNHFLQKTFPPGNVLVNQRQPDGSAVLFRGIDAESRTALLRLIDQTIEVPVDGQEQPDQRRLVTLILSYIQDTENLDVFTVEEGAF